MNYNNRNTFIKVTGFPNNSQRARLIVTLKDAGLGLYNSYLITIFT